MKAVLHFKKHFRRGILEGLTHKDSLSFASTKDASNWIKGVNRNSEKKYIPFDLEVIGLEIVE